MAKIKRNLIPNFSELWNESYRGLIKDLKATEWLRELGWLMGVVWVSFLLASICIISLISFSSTANACQADDRFRLRPNDFSLWSSTGFFQITLGGGHLTFTKAKVIDISWDIFLGRGGQLILTFVSWKVFSKYITICMDVQPISYQTFRIIFLQNEASVISTYGIIKSFIWQRRIRSKIAMTFIILSMIFILAFPTLASAMSGYTSNVSSYIPNDNKDDIPFQKFERVIYVIHDGKRIRDMIEEALTSKDMDLYEIYGEHFNNTDVDKIIALSEMGEGRIVNYRHYPDGDPVLYDKVCKLIRDSTRFEMYQYVLSPSDPCWLELQVSNYVWNYGLGGMMNTSSTFNLTTNGGYVNITLPPPVLNISAYLNPEDNTQVRPNDTGLLKVQSWDNGNQTYDITYIQKSGKCQNTGDYKWGFSFLQLLICLILLIIWTAGTFTLWLRAHFTQKLNGRDSSLISGEHKAVLELADAMQHELDFQHKNVSLLVEKKLNDQVNNELKGGSIPFTPAHPRLKMYSFKKEIKKWLEREMFWVPSTIVTSFLSSALWMSQNTRVRWFWFWSFGLSIGMVFAMRIGTSNGSRVLMILFWCHLFMLIVLSCKASNVEFGVEWTNPLLHKTYFPPSFITE